MSRYLILLLVSLYLYTISFNKLTNKPNKTKTSTKNLSQS